MTHLSHETLWSFARGEAAGGEVQGHLDACAQCRASLADVQLAQKVLADLPEAPPMPPALARRVGDALSDEAERRLASRWTSWLAFDLPRFALVGAAAVALVFLAWLAARAPSSSPAPSPTPPAPLVRQDAPEPPAPVVAPAPRQLTAGVASAKRAKTGGAALAQAQVLAPGATVATERGGSVWMHLPDGTRAGVAAESQVQLVRLEEKTLTLEVETGSLAMLVPHREERVLTVRAGEVTVRDLGTRFVVSREQPPTGPGRVLVAVEEGEVELSAPGHTQVLTAGHAAEWHDGQLELTQYELPGPVIVTRPDRGTPPAVAAAVDAPTSAARLGGEEDGDDEAPPPPAPADEGPASPAAPPPPAPGELDEGWAAPPTAQPTPDEPPAAQPEAPPPAVETATPERHPFALRAIERRVDELRRQLHDTFPPVGTGLRQAAARAVGKLADAGDCVGALDAADRWLRAPPGAGADEPALRRHVLLQKRRCLIRLGRAAEAAEVSRELDGLPPP